MINKSSESKNKVKFVVFFIVFTHFVAHNTIQTNGMKCKMSGFYIEFLFRFDELQSQLARLDIAVKPLCIDIAIYSLCDGMKTV